jgi:hypothetical protein
MNTKREETKTKPNDAAFPQNPHTALDTGLTKREYFAAIAMQGLVTVIHHTDRPYNVAKAAVMTADALIEELNKK